MIFGGKQYFAPIYLDKAGLTKRGERDSSSSKIKKRALANLSDWPEANIEGLRRVPRPERGNFRLDWIMLGGPTRRLGILYARRPRILP